METIRTYKSEWHTTATIARRMCVPYYGATNKCPEYRLTVTADYDDNEPIYVGNYESLGDAVHYLAKNFYGFKT